MKHEIDSLNVIPSKRVFLSIIADYDLNRSVCELIDNALDVWVRTGRKKPVTIAVILDKGQQRIVIQDDAGGVARRN
jgi:pyrimidine operon attenuation protein/uracil phosphoribosyltransferase